MFEVGKPIVTVGKFWSILSSGRPVWEWAFAGGRIFVAQASAERILCSRMFQFSTEGSRREPKIHEQSPCIKTFPLIRPAPI